MSTNKQVLNVHQHNANNHFARNIDGFKKTDQFIYAVKTIKNRLEPAVGTIVSAARLRDLIDSGVEVNVTSSK